MTGRSGQGGRVPCWVGRGGYDGAASRVRGGVFPVLARGGLGPWRYPQTSQEGAAEVPEDLVHKGCVRCLGFRLSAAGGQQLSAQRKRPDLVDRANGAQASRRGGLRRSLVWGDGLQLLSAVQVEPPRRCPVLDVRPAALSPPPEAVEGMPRGPAAGFTQHDGRQGVSGLVLGQGGGAVRQGCARQEHGVDGPQGPVAPLQVRGDPHLVVVAPPNTIMEMVLGSSSRREGPACAVSAAGGYRSTMSLRLRPLSGAVLLFQSARPLYGGMLRALALGFSFLGMAVPRPKHCIKAA